MEVVRLGDAKPYFPPKHADVRCLRLQGFEASGAAGAFGQVAALSLAAAGARVTLAARDLSKLEAVGQEVKELGGEAVLVNLRPDELSDAEAMVAAAVRAHGRLDCVVTAAGLNKVALIVDQDPADWDEVQRANVRGTWLVCLAATVPTARPRRPSTCSARRWRANGAGTAST